MKQKWSIFWSVMQDMGRESSMSGKLLNPSHVKVNQVLIMSRDIPVEEFEYTINVNLRASFVLVKGVIEGMKAQKWGRIIFMSSIAALGGGINGCRSSSPFPMMFPIPPFSVYSPFTQTTQHLNPVCLA